MTLLVSQDWIQSTDRVLIIDDFMANGEAMRGLCAIVDNAPPLRYVGNKKTISGKERKLT